MNDLDPVRGCSEALGSLLAGKPRDGDERTGVPSSPGPHEALVCVSSPGEARSARDIVNGRNERPPGREQRAREIEEMEEVDSADGGDGLLGCNAPGPRTEGRAPESEVLYGNSACIDSFGSVAGRDESESQVGKVRARLVEGARDRSCVPRDAGVSGGDQSDKPDGERFAQRLDRR